MDAGTPDVGGPDVPARAKLAELLTGDVRIPDLGPLLATLRATEIMLGRCYHELADAAEGADRADAAAELRAAGTTT